MTNQSSPNVLVVKLTMVLFTSFSENLEKSRLSVRPCFKCNIFYGINNKRGENQTWYIKSLTEKEKEIYERE